MRTFETYSYYSKIRKINPAYKIFFGIIMMILCLLFNSNYISCFILLILWILTKFMSAIPFKKYIKVFLIPFIFLSLGTFTIMFVSINDYQKYIFKIVIFDSNYGITNQSLKLGIDLILKSLATISCMYFIILNTPINDIFNFLIKLKVPLIIVNLMELIYTYIFVIAEEATYINIAQQSRMGYRNIKNSFNSLGNLIGSLFIKVYNKCDMIYNALESRGYDGELKKIEIDYEKNIYFDFIIIVIILLTLIIGILEKVLAS